MNNGQPRNLKGYELLERLGAGGFGAVYRARQSTIGREVAVKVILPGIANQPEFIRRFETEAQLVARLEHPHITPLHDYWRDPEGAYLVMRYLKGGSIRDALKDSAYDLTAISRLLDQIAAALDFAHRHDVIHRDIKPGNILLDEDGNAYLADFGIAKDLTRSADSGTRPDGVVGSLDYISPEQARSEPVTPRTDIYSLGVTLYEMITGQHPFQQYSTVERLYKHINNPLPTIDHLPDDLRDTINQIIQCATAKDPDRRYPDVLALAVAFREGVGRGDTSRDLSVVEQLTVREQEILQLIADGASNKEIADLLFVTVGTVKWHIRQVYRKLGVRSRVQAMIRARELELLVSGQTSADWPDAAAVPAPAMISLPEPENPYKGLHAFQTGDVRDFFGREELTEKLVSRLEEKHPFSRFLTIVGPSGSGKSSLVKAGLIPALWRGGLPGSEKWFVVEMLPGSRPLDELEIALTRVAANQGHNLRQHLARDEFGLVRVAELILPQDGTELVLVVDQLEEVFTLVEDEEERVQFLNLLRAAVTDKRSRVRVIATLRADYYDRPLHYPEFGELIRSRMETILPLSVRGLERAVRGPAERVGVTFEPGLTEQIVSEMTYQAGALPLLQYALAELFDRRQGRLLTHAAYQEIGGAVGALAHRADEIYLSFTGYMQQLTRQLFLRLVTLGEGAEDTRRRANRGELLSLTEYSDAMEEIIDAFADHRLLSLDHDDRTRQPTVEVAHEAILREWERLRGWLNESRADVRLQRQLASSAVEWKHQHRDASYLLRGSRLQQVEQWAQVTELALTPLEREFIAESTTQREARQQAEAERQAREARLEQRSRNFLRLLVVVFALAAVLSGGFGVFALTERNAADLARIEAQRSAEEIRSIALTFGAQQALDNDQPDVALALALQAIKMDNPPIHAQQTFFTATTSSWIQKRFLVSDARVFDAVYHPDGERIITTSLDGRTIVWDIETGEELQSIGREGWATFLDIHPDGNIIAIGGAPGSIPVQVWNLETNAVIDLVTDEGIHSPPTFTADGKRLVSGFDGKDILVWDTETWQVINSWKAHDGFIISSIRFNHDESLLVTGSADTFVKIWDFETGDLLQTFNLQEVTSRPDVSAWVWNAQFLPDGEHVLIGGGFEMVLWNWQTDEIVWIVSETSVVHDIALSPDSTTFVVGLEGISAQVRDVSTGRLIRSYEVGHTGRTQNVDYSPDGTTVLTGNGDGTVVIWPVFWEGFKEHYLVPDAIAGLALHPTQPFAALAPQDPAASINLVDINTGEVIQEFTGHRGPVIPLVFSLDGRYLLASEYAAHFDPMNQSVIVWDIETGEQIFVLDNHLGWTVSIAMSPDKRTVAVGESIGGRIILWDIDAREPIRALEGQQDWVMAIVFSPDGRYLYSSGRNGSLLKWDMQSGEVVMQFAVQRSPIHNLDVNADGTRLVSGHGDGTVTIWDTDTAMIVLTLEGQSLGNSAVDFHPYNETLITSASDGTIILWNAETGDRLNTYAAFEGDGPTALTAYFSLDGEYIISGGGNSLIIWDVLPLEEDLMTWVENNRYIPDFTCEQRELYHIEPLCETDP
jgi:WD40 repeat protein/serine/threonine protein kinase